MLESNLSAAQSLGVDGRAQEKLHPPTTYFTSTLKTKSEKLYAEAMLRRTIAAGRFLCASRPL